MKSRILSPLILSLLLLLPTACSGTLEVGVEGPAGPLTLEVSVEGTPTPTSQPTARPTTTPVAADDGYRVLFQDGFDGGDTSRWRSSWIAAEEAGNWYWRGASGVQAQLVTPIIRSTYRFRADVRLWNGSVDLSYRQEYRGEGGYHLVVTPERLLLHRFGQEEPVQLADEPAPIAVGRWHTVEISGTLGHIQVLVDGNLHIDQLDPDPWYAGTIGLSVAGGSTAYADFDNVQVLVPANDEPGWDQTSGPTGGIVNAIEIDSYAPNVLYAGGAGGAVFKSTNGGNSWDMLPPIVPPWQPIHDILVAPGETQMVYALADWLYKSVDGGESWVTPTPEHAFHCVALAPDNPFSLVAATWDRVYRSPDGGESWVDATGNLPPAPITDVAMGRDAELWAGTGGDEGDLYHTVDDGVTWRKESLGAPPGTHVASILVDAQNPRTVYVGLGSTRDERGAPDERRLFVTRDGGGTWTPLTLPEPPGLVGVMGQAQNGTALYVAAGFHVYRSSDGGQTWATITPPGPPGGVTDIAVDPHDANVLYLLRQGHGVSKSTDGGSSWSTRAQELHNVHVSLLAVSGEPGNDTVYASSAAGAGVFKTTNWGDSWVPLFPGDDGTSPSRFDALVVNPHDPSVAWLATDTGEVFATANDGETWRLLVDANDDGFRFGSVYALAAASDTVYALKNGFGLFKSVDGGTSWHFLPESLVTHASNIAVHPAEPDVVYCGAAPGPNLDRVVVRQSTDGGLTWHTALTCTNAAGVAAAVAVAIAPDDPDTVYAGCTGAGGAFWVSEDAGRTWSRGNPPTDAFEAVQLVVDPADARTVYAATYPGGVFKSADGGQTWGRRDAGLPPVAVDDPVHQGSYALVIAPSDPQTLYLGLYGEGVYRSTDGAATWQPANGADQVLRGQPITALLADPADPELVVAATEHGVYRTTDAGQHWTDFSAGLGSTDVWVLARGADGTTLYAGTRGYEVYACDEPGTHWRQLSPLGNWDAPWPAWGDRLLHQHTALLFHPANPNVVYAGVFPAGVFKSEDGGRTWRERAVRRPVVDGVRVAADGVGWLNNGGVLCLTIPRERPDTLYAGTTDGVLRSRDGGDHWEVLGGDTPARGWILSIDFDPREPGVMYACGRDDGNPEGVRGIVLRSVDGGESWSPIVQGLDTHQGFLRILVDPHAPDTLYLATEHEGVFVSRDAGGLWLPWNEGLTNPAAGVDGRGLGVPLALSIDSRILYWGSAGSGVFRREIVR